MSQLLRAVFDVPDLIKTIFTGKYALIAVLILIVYLVVMFVNNNVTRFIREGLILLAVVGAVVGYFKRKFAFLWLMLILVALILIVRFLCYLLVTIRISRRNRRIERKALEKAALRRGSWKEKRGYSGTRPEDDEPVNPGVMDEREIADVVANETMEKEGASIDLSFPGEENAAKPDAASSIGRGERLSRTVVLDAVRKLDDLHALGVLTDEETSRKKSELFSRMG